MDRSSPNEPAPSHHCRVARALSGANAAPAVSEADLERLRWLDAVARGRGTLAQARELAGLSVGQAAKVLGWTRERILALEAGADPTTAERGALCDTYAVDGWVASKAEP